MGKLFFFDIDGTLTGVEKPGYIYESTKEAIRQLKANGHFVALATGRAAFRARMFQEEIGIENMICEGGNQLIINGKPWSIHQLINKWQRQFVKKH